MIVDMFLFMILARNFKYRVKSDDSEEGKAIAMDEREAKNE